VHHPPRSQLDDEEREDGPTPAGPTAVVAARNTNGARLAGTARPVNRSA